MTSYGGSYDYGRKDKKDDFALLVVLFVLLIIVGTAFKRDHYYY